MHFNPKYWINSLRLVKLAEIAKTNITLCTTYEAIERTTTVTLYWLLYIIDPPLFDKKKMLISQIKKIFKGGEHEKKAQNSFVYHYFEILSTKCPQ